MARPFESRQLPAFRDFSSLVKSPSFVRPLSIYGRVLSIGPVLEGPVVHTSPTYVAPLTDARAFLRRYSPRSSLRSTHRSLALLLSLSPSLPLAKCTTLTLLFKSNPSGLPSIQFQNTYSYFLIFEYLRR